MRHRPGCLCRVHERRREREALVNGRVFESLAERDAFIERVFPRRRAMSTPGAFRVPGGVLTVFLSTITFHPTRRGAA
jgi:hypothetical protein